MIDDKERRYLVKSKTLVDNSGRGLGKQLTLAED